MTSSSCSSHRLWREVRFNWFSTKSACINGGAGESKNASGLLPEMGLIIVSVDEQLTKVMMSCRRQAFNKWLLPTLLFYCWYFITVMYLCVSVLFIIFFYPYQPEQCRSHSRHSRNIYCMNEVLRIWRGDHRNGSPCAMLNQTLVVLLAIVKNFESTYVSNSRGQLNQWWCLTCWNPMSFLAEHIVQYFGWGKCLLILLEWKKKGVTQQYVQYDLKYIRSMYA